MAEKLELMKRNLSETLAQASPGLPLSSQLFDDNHTKYFISGLTSLPQFTHFETQKPWVLYWNLNGLAALQNEDLLPPNIKKLLSDHLACLIQDSGAFGGSGKMEPHLLSSYAGVLAAVLLDREELWAKLDREKFKGFLKDMLIEPGKFVVNRHGEHDLRANFAAIVIGDILGFLDDPIFENVAEQILKCQTYEGGFGPIPNVEAHGGFTFCAIGALSLLKCLEKANVEKLTRWIVEKQTEFGGFCGRTGKLVDSCYSFWQAANFNILRDYFANREDHRISNLLYDIDGLQRYILVACQSPKGGLRDKPGKPEDIYHSMYSLLGLSLSFSHEEPQRNFAVFEGELNTELHPVISVPVEKYLKAKAYFANKK